jgi:hypothetical protein
MSSCYVYPNYVPQGNTNSLQIYGSSKLRLANAKSTRHEPPRKSRKFVKIDPPKLLSSILITMGAIALFISVIYTSSILAFIGLGLLFFGVTFTFIRSDEYVKKTLLDATASSQQATLKYIVQELQYDGREIYLPPKYFRNSEIYKAYISEQKNGRLPRPEEIQEHEQDFLIENPSGILFIPPGAELSKLFETTLRINFAKVDLQYLQEKMPKLFMEDLEIAQAFEIESKNNKIRVKIQGSVYVTSYKETEEQLGVHSTLDSPLSSAIACSLAKTTGKPVIIEKQQTSEDGKDVTVEYSTIDDEEQAEQ